MDPDAMTSPPSKKTVWRKAVDGAAIGLALLFAYVLVLFGVFTALNIVSPLLAEDPAVVFFLTVVCAIVVVGPPVGGPALVGRLRTLPDDSLKTEHTDNALVPMIRTLRIRSRLFKLGATAAFVLVAAATLLGFTVAQGQSANGTTTGTGVTSLVLLLFLLQTLASIYRHNMRMAAFYDSKADYLQAGGKTKGLDDRNLLNLFSTAQIDPNWSEKLKEAFEPRDQKPRK